MWVCCCLSVSFRGDVVKLVCFVTPCARTAAIYTQRVQVVLHNGISQEVQLRAYLHATYLAATLNQVCCVDARQQLCTRGCHNRRLRVATLGPGFSAAAAWLGVQGTAATAPPAELISRSQRWVEQNLPGFLALLQKQDWQLDKLYLPRPEWTAQW